VPSHRQRCAHTAVGKRDSSGLFSWRRPVCVYRSALAVIDRPQSSTSKCQHRRRCRPGSRFISRCSFSRVVFLGK